MFDNLFNFFRNKTETKETTNVSSDIVITKDIYYSDGYINKSSKSKKKLYMDRYEIPTKSDVLFRKCVILVHGGGFDKGDKAKSEIVNIAKNLAKEGYTVFSINYRLEKDEPPAPFPFNGNKTTSAAHASVVDLKSAIRFIKGNSINYKIDKDYIFVVGESAGAIASVAVGVTNNDKFMSDGPGYEMPNKQYEKESARVNKVVSLWGSGTFVLGDFDKSDPPMMVVHGTKDNTLGASFLESILMTSQCKKVGIPYEYYKLQGYGHGAWDAKVNGKTLSQLIAEFLIK